MLTEWNLLSLSSTSSREWRNATWSSATSWKMAVATYASTCTWKTLSLPSTLQACLRLRSNARLSLMWRKTFRIAKWTSKFTKLVYWAVQSGESYRSRSTRLKTHHTYSAVTTSVRRSKMAVSYWSNDSTYVNTTESSATRRKRLMSKKSWDRKAWSLLWQRLVSLIISTSCFLSHAVTYSGTTSTVTTSWTWWKEEQTSKPLQKF